MMLVSFIDNRDYVEAPGNFAGRLQTDLSETTDTKSVKRLMIAIAYKNGVGVSTIATLYEPVIESIS